MSKSVYQFDTEKAMLMSVLSHLILSWVSIFRCHCGFSVRWQRCSFALRKISETTDLIYFQLKSGKLSKTCWIWFFEFIILQIEYIKVPIYKFSQLYTMIFLWGMFVLPRYYVRAVSQTDGRLVVSAYPRCKHPSNDIARKCLQKKCFFSVFLFLLFIL